MATVLLFDYYPQQVDAELGDFGNMGISMVWKGMRELDASCTSVITICCKSTCRVTQEDLGKIEDGECMFHACPKAHSPYRVGMGEHGTFIYLLNGNHYVLTQSH